jgi:hypothetical protein
MNEIETRVEEAKRFEFLKRVCEVAGDDPARCVPTGDLGEELALPYEEAIRLADALDADGLVQRVGDLAPPHGPRVHVTPRGIDLVRRHAA